MALFASKTGRLCLNGLLIALLCICSFFIWGSNRDRLDFKKWDVPPTYRGDDVLILGWIQAAKDGDFAPFKSCFIQRLGAPYTANWDDYPMYEKLLIWLAGQFAKFIGIIPSYTLMIYLCHATAAVSFFLCARFLRVRREWAFAGAIIFAFIYYQLFCNVGGQLFRSFIYPVPFAILTTWLISFSKRMVWGDKSFWICLITSLVMGMSFPYTLFMFLQFLGFAVLFQWIFTKRKENWQIGLACIGVAMVAFFAIHLNTLAYGWIHGKNTDGMHRHYMECEINCLKPMEMVVPPFNHRWDLFSRIGHYYQSQAAVKGEIFSPYLGIIGMIALVWIAIEMIVAIMRPKDGRRVPAHALQIIWVFAFATLGGINCLLGLDGIMFFRSSNRYSIVVSTIVLMFLIVRLSRFSLRWTRGISIAAAFAVTVFALTDQLPIPAQPAETERVRALVQNDKKFDEEMQAKLPAGGMVFEMPAQVFPEALPMGQLLSYELLMPYCNTTNLRFSFGSVRGRTREDWQFEVEKMPGPEMVSTLQRYGFSAIYINLKGYSQEQAQDLVKKFSDAGCPVVCQDDMHYQVCFGLHPSATPELPHTDARADIVMKNGWVIHERTPLENVQWSDGDASLKFFNDQKNATPYTLTCAVASVSPRRVSILMKGRELWSGEVPAGKAEPVRITLDAWPRYNDIEFKTDQPAVQASENGPLLAIGVMNLQITRNF